ncbi:dihydropteroate synthase [Ottowia testudinis]|uniref:Dihydropteroate synthase n=1 Tax=Ottowia testudinis TaxID=2816950 RepID=A0A975CLL0_9BURK|nr:dihydropteroate synthase [Ottowia testudinis]QTD46439.1 dihydropteroate synthase [Ottowia testudinis]
MSFWKTTRFEIDLGQPRVMGIVNVTPDSFSDGGEHADTASALRHAEQLLKEGAHILDIGGESTRPGSPPVLLDEELARVVPLVREAVKFSVPISVDTYKPEVMAAVLDLGADIINDIWGLRRESETGGPGALDVVRGHPACGVCLMHMHRDPQTMQAAPMQGDVVPQVLLFLEQTMQAVQAQGVQKSRIVLDPGIGFGKTVAQNFALLARQAELLQAGLPLLLGWSRKSSIGAVLQGNAREAPPPAERVIGSVAAALMAVERGASIVRVHDVAATVQALQMYAAVRAAG